MDATQINGLINVWRDEDRWNYFVIRKRILNLTDDSDSETYPGPVMIRFDGPLFFATANALRDKVKTVTLDVSPPVNNVAVSAVSFWVISLQFALGKLELSGVDPDDLPDFAHQMNLATLPITDVEGSSFHRLPRLSHKDPFDRMIIWQAIQQNMILVSKDSDFKAYHQFGLRTLW